MDQTPAKNDDHIIHAMRFSSTAPSNHFLDMCEKMKAEIDGQFGPAIVFGLAAGMKHLELVLEVRDWLDDVSVIVSNKVMDDITELTVRGDIVTFTVEPPFLGDLCCELDIDGDEFVHGAVTTLCRSRVIGWCWAVLYYIRDMRLDKITVGRVYSECPEGYWSGFV